MGYGGPTFETAGVLHLGTGNTFNTADATFNEDGWWAFTSDITVRVKVDPAASEGSGNINMAVYQGSEDNQIASNSAFVGRPTLEWDAEAGVTYHLRVMRKSGTVTKYVLNVTRRRYTYTDWSTVLRDRTDNWIIVSSRAISDLSESLGELMTLNRAPYNNPANNPLIGYVITERAGGQPLVEGEMTLEEAPGRRGSYEIQEVLGGSEPETTGAPECAWGHATNGDQGFQYWNTSMVSADDNGPPVCAAIFPGVADPAGNSPYPEIGIGESGGGPFSNIITATERLVAGGVWVKWAKDLLPVYGVLNPFTDLNTISLGVPSGYTGPLEFEYEDDLELTKVEVAGDKPDRSVSAPEGRGSVFALNDQRLPGYNEGDPGVGNPGEWMDHWNKGTFPSAGETGDDPRAYLTFTYSGGGVEWIEYPSITGWDDCRDPFFEKPDITYGITIAGDQPEIDEEFNGDSDLAVRLTFRAPRVRARYLLPEQTVIPPRQIFGRPGDIAQGAAQVYGQGATIQGGSAVYGGVL